MRKNGFFSQFAPVCCDWMTGRHEYAEAIAPRESGRILRVSAEGVIDYETQLWEQIKCPSSDTSLRVRCDGHSLKFTGNIGRFGQPDNITGLTVMQCVERWGEVLRRLGFHVPMFGTRFARTVGEGCGESGAFAPGGSFEAGTCLTRIDLAGNFEVSDYDALCQVAMSRRIKQKLPMMGRYGPTWGYEAKRANWWKFKLYDKTAEQSNKRRSSGGETLARGEVQLGSEFLKRENLDVVNAWKDTDMENVVYGRFAEPVFAENMAVQDWAELPPRLQHWATLWREGRDLRALMKVPTYYRVRAKLLESGIDIGTPCNIIALTRHIRMVEVRPVSALRVA